MRQTEMKKHINGHTGAATGCLVGGCLAAVLKKCAVCHQSWKGCWGGGGGGGGGTPTHFFRPEKVVAKIHRGGGGEFPPAAPGFIPSRLSVSRRRLSRSRWRCMARNTTGETGCTGKAVRPAPPGWLVSTGCLLLPGPPRTTCRA